VKRLSVVITNWNYERYVGDAIESALALRWPDVEVVVVDDGSTDGSRAVLQRYSDRVHVLHTANGGQREAANRGYAIASGDVVIFLDADDMLPADLPGHLDVAMAPEVSKVQFRMQRIDAEGRPFGDPFPRVRAVPSAERIRRWQIRTTGYPTPPGSGNAYARWFLDRVMPVGPETGRAADSALLAAAPLLGDVRWLPDVLVRYRVHGANDSSLLGDPGAFAREVRRARDRWRYALDVSGRPRDDAALHRSREVLQFRAAAVRLAPTEEGLPGDGRSRVLRDALLAPFQPGPEPIGIRLVVSAWSAAVALVPSAVALRLVQRRYRR
jgi:glycosyltransferase involved in cell wall biosynthesis